MRRVSTSPPPDPRYCVPSLFPSISPCLPLPRAACTYAGLPRRPTRSCMPPAGMKTTAAPAHYRETRRCWHAPLRMHSVPTSSPRPSRETSWHSHLLLRSPIAQYPPYALTHSVSTLPRPSCATSARCARTLRRSPVAQARSLLLSLMHRMTTPPGRVSRNYALPACLLRPRHASHRSTPIPSAHQRPMGRQRCNSSRPQRLHSFYVLRYCASPACLPLLPLVHFLPRLAQNACDQVHIALRSSCTRNEGRTLRGCSARASAGAIAEDIST
ncbi:hypothetical protein HYPSUDRAFT_586960 [Hypholoma sublateritium FD-334 SS-4]|uniref:Uncharacterized protein n=1 Tax=Hypholoma sublateritium (strain FD-334 SS-4) TaxID=945553 RepID=A0A0D2NXC3_HYPSF|nr:hypothetical protein HYPSUDRAFT_586960 [Hypholoma sublateritium FD-334 SS-4]